MANSITYAQAKRTSKPGEGKRFKALAQELMGEGKSKASAQAIAASIGRKKYGAKKMSKMAFSRKRRK